MPQFALVENMLGEEPTKETEFTSGKDLMKHLNKEKKMNYGKLNKKKFNEATKLIEQNAGSKEEKMTKFTYSLHEQLKAHIKDPEEWNNIMPVNCNFTLEEYEEMMYYISQGWLVQNDGWPNNGFIVNPEWDREPLWEPEEEEVETDLKWVPDKGLINVEKEEKEEEEECPTTIQYRKEIEEGCPEGSTTIWNQYGFKYEPLSEIEKWRQGQPSFNLDDKDALQKFEKLCSDSRDRWTFTKPEDLKVGDIVREYLTTGIVRLIQVSRLSAKSIWYRKCPVKKYEIQSETGYKYTFGIWLGELTDREEESGEFKEFRKKRETEVREELQQESWRGEWVCDKSEMIWAQVDYYDPWQ